MKQLKIDEKSRVSFSMGALWIIALAVVAGIWALAAAYWRIEFRLDAMSTNNITWPQAVEFADRLRDANKAINLIVPSWPQPGVPVGMVMPAPDLLRPDNRIEVKK